MSETRFRVGDRVSIKVDPAVPAVAMMEAFNPSRPREGAGSITAVHGSRGLCYTVWCDAGVEGCYDPSELSVADDPKPIIVNAAGGQGWPV